MPEYKKHFAISKMIDDFSSSQSTVCRKVSHDELNKHSGSWYTGTDQTEGIIWLMSPRWVQFSSALKAVARKATLRNLWPFWVLGTIPAFANPSGIPQPLSIPPFPSSIWSLEIPKDVPRCKQNVCGPPGWATYLPSYPPTQCQEDHESLSA